MIFEFSILQIDIKFEGISAAQSAIAVDHI